jgi:hypothetical protein
MGMGEGKWVGQQGLRVGKLKERGCYAADWNFTSIHIEKQEEKQSGTESIMFGINPDEKQEENQAGRQTIRKRSKKRINPKVET